MLVQELFNSKCSVDELTLKVLELDDDTRWNLNRFQMSYYFENNPKWDE